MSDDVADAISASIKELSAEGDDDATHEEADGSQEDLQQPAGDKPAEAAEGEREAAKDDKKDEPSDQPKAKKADKSRKKGGEPAKKGGDDASVEGTWSHDKPPQSWSPPMRDKWGSLPEDIRREITRREEATVQGVRQMQERFQPLQRFAQDMVPVFDAAKEAGQHPLQYVGGMMTTERILRNGSPQARFNEIVRVAESYGVPLREIINRSIGEEILKAPASQQRQGPADPQAHQRIQALEQERNLERQAGHQREIESFKKDKEFFEDVRVEMADYLDAGICSTLEEAYDKACWANPEIRDVMRQRERAEKDKEKLRKKQETARGIGVRADDTLEEEQDKDDDSVEATVRAAWVASSGRL